MRRSPRLPRLFNVLTIIVSSAAGFCSSNSFAQQSSPTPQVAVPTPNQAATTPAVQKVDPLLEQLDLAIEVTSKRYLTANEHSPWQIFHGILAMKREFQLKLGDQKVNALEWIASSEPQFDKQPLLLKTRHGGKFHPFTRPWAFEGHPSQFLALMSQSELPVDYSFKVGSERITIADMVQNTMMEVNSKEEVTWVLWALQHYLKPDTKWANEHGEAWSIEKLVQIETASPVVGAACGGNHRLFALTRTRDKHLLLGGKLNGVWAQADLKIRQHIELARQLQNSDGSFSAKFYEAPKITNDVNERFNTTGHTMEFLSIGLPDGRLNEPWVRNAATVLARELVFHRQRQIDCGPLYHSLNSLMIYRERLRALTPTYVATKETNPAKLNTASGPTPALPTVVMAPTEKSLGNKPESVNLPNQTVVRTPSENKNPVGTSASTTAPGSIKKPDGLAPGALAPAVKPGIAATIPAATMLNVTILKTIDPGRVVQMRPIEQSGEGQPIRLLPNVTKSPADAFQLPFNDPDSFDSTVGTLKPRFENPPSASRVITRKDVSQTPKQTTEVGPPASLADPVNDEPASAITPANG